MTKLPKNLTAEDAYRYWLLLNNSADAVFIMDQRGKLVEFSEHTCALLGYSPEETKNLTVFDWDPDMTPEEYGQIVTALTEEPVRIQRRHRRKDGSIYFADISVAKFNIGIESVIYATTRDISKEKALANKVEEQNKELNAIFEHVAEGIALINTDGSIRRANGFMTELLGADESTVSHCRICDFLNEAEAADWESLVDDVMSTGKRRWFETAVRTEPGHSRYLRLSVTPVPSLQQMLVGAADITADHRYRESLFKTSVTDELTGLPNRRAFKAAIAQSIRQYRRNGIPFSLLIADLDNFKRVNDTLGHLEGDRVLMETANALTSRLRSHDYCFRIGGEEFAIILADTHRTDAHAVAESLRRRIDRSVKAEELPVTVSIGLAQMTDRDTFSSLFEKADQRLYAAKTSGKNRVCHAVEELATA
jgi:diguanylate cyclase (GGDEF)-like protein/PAS domain S-box-containing protein